MMSEQPADLLVRQGTTVLPHGIVVADIAVRDGRICAIGDLRDLEAREVIDAQGLHVLPGVIDPQVHFREPGGEAKEDLESGTRAAVLGGVTAVFEMPNTQPPTTTKEAFEDKLKRASGRAHCDIAFFVGASSENAEQLGELERLPGCCGVKVFMGSSTGTLLVPDDETLRRVFSSGSRRVALHAEDEDRLNERKPLASEELGVHLHPVWRDAECARLATERAIAAARACDRKIHVLHVTTKEEIPLLRGARDVATFEIPPQHLTLSAPECYDRLGTFAQMNPPIREASHRDALWGAIEEGLADALGSDHAPHLREEKSRSYPGTPSGMPGVQTMVPIMLDHVSQGRLSLERLVELVCSGPAHIYGVRDRGRLEVGALGSLTLVDLKAEREITNQWIASKCGWTPFDGKKVTGWPVATIVRGATIMREDEILCAPMGVPVEFDLQA